MLEQIAYIEGQNTSAALTRDEQRQLGQFMTPWPIARFMARRAVEGLRRDVVRVLEPAAGSGVLVAAVVKALCAVDAPPRRVEVLAYEIDHRLLPALAATCARCVEEARDQGVNVAIELRCADFLLAPLCLAQRPAVDVVIANPPYFKLNAQSACARAHAYAVHGQPNIYGLFMAASAALLRDGGRFCFITPRSWATGPYFKAVRRHLLSRLRLDALHVFRSRTGHFEDDGVLQEAMVTWATADTARGHVALSTSDGAADLADSVTTSRPEVGIVVGSDRCIVLAETHAAADALAGWTECLATLGLKVSTGPTVPFRNRAHLADASGERRVPLLWMQHVRRMQVRWPVGRRAEHIEACSQTSWMLLHNEPMVLARRFSPKEDVRRMTAAAYCGELPCSFIGLENHLNYIHRPGGTLTAGEVVGLAAVMNSARADAYFRAVSGNTQINAAELRGMPLPGWPGILEIADRLADGPVTLERIDVAVEGAASIAAAA